MARVSLEASATVKPRKEELIFKQSVCCWFLTLFDMGEGAIMAPKMFLTTVLKRLGGGSWNFVTFNINPRSIKESYFGFLGNPALP